MYTRVECIYSILVQTVLTEMSELNPPETLSNPELESPVKRLLEEAPKPSFVPDAVSYMYKYRVCTCINCTRESLACRCNNTCTVVHVIYRCAPWQLGA